MYYNTNRYFGIRRSVFSAIHHIALLGMLHSTFAAPSQGIIEAYFNKQGNNNNNNKKGYYSSSDNSTEPSAKAEAINYIEGTPVASPQVPGAVAVKPGVFSADIKEGIIGISKDMPVDNPSDNLFTIRLEALPSAGDKVYLAYELYGLASHHSVARSINERFSTGGYMVKQHRGWSVQKEELDPLWLKQGANSILFTTPKGADHQYKVRNLSLVIEKGTASAQALVVAQSTLLLTSGDKVYIKGFLKGLPSGARVEAGNTSLEVSGNEFEGYVVLTEEAKQQKFIMVRAFDGQGLLGQEPVWLDNLAAAEKAYQPEGKPSAESREIKACTASGVSVEGASVAIGEDAIAGEMEVSLVQLRAIDLAPLGSGIVNVTKSGKGYRLLPYNGRFTAPVSIAIEYDPSLLPSGYTAKDIRTYFFDRQSKRWVAVEKDSLDTANHRILSKTTHFNDYINGVIQAPESPESTAFLPTMMNDIKAADPSSQIPLISPPDASQKGDANVSFPIKLPAGRNGMQPQLSLQYSNEGGSGWLGLGWGLSVPSVNVDSRWGVPLFDPAKETELYSMNGEQLIYPGNYLPHRHQGTAGSYTTDQQARSADKEFTPRRQGSFARIERLGSSPSTYYWKVTGTDGSVSWYGGKTPSDVSSGAAVIRDEDNNIIHWGLFMTEDVFGNNIKYAYEPITVSGQTGAFATLNGAKSLYLKQINYTGYNGGTGSYQVDFERAATIRPDVTYSARLGVKQAEPYLLNEIIVKYQNHIIRKYDFSYNTGAFGKRLLTAVRERDKDNNMLYDYKFQYYNDVAANSNSLFKSPVSIGVPSFNPNYSLGFGDLPLVDPSVINTIQSTETGFSLRPGAGFQIRLGTHNGDPEGTLTVGAAYGQSTLKSKGKVTLSDIDGDGLDDILYRTGDGLQYLPNQPVQNTDGSLGNAFSSNYRSVHNANDFSKNQVKSETVFGDSWDIQFLQFFAGTQRVKSKSEAIIYFTDANNDGLMDIVNDGKVQFNRIDPVTNEPSFTTNSELTPNMVITASAPVGEPQPTPEEQEEEQQDPVAEPFDDDYDVVRVWIAPVKGKISIENKITNLGPGQANFSIERTFSDGTVCPVYYTTIQNGFASTLWVTHLSPMCGLGEESIFVDKGDKLFFRLHKNPTGANPELDVDHIVHYEDMDVPYGVPGYDYTHSSSFFSFVTSKDEPVIIPGTGTVKISWDDIYFGEKDEVEYQIIKRVVNAQGSIISETTIYSAICPQIPGGATVSETPNLDGIAVTEPGTSFIFRVKCDTNVLKYGLGFWTTVYPEYYPWWRPKVTFTPDTASANAGIGGFSSYAVPDYTTFRKADFKGRYCLVPSGSDPTAPGWTTPNAAKDYNVKPNTAIVNASVLTSSDNGTFIFAAKNASDEPIQKRVVNIVNGNIVLPDATPITFCTSCNVYNLDPTYKYYFFGYYVDEENIEVFEKYLQAVGMRSAVVSYTGNSASNVNKTTVVSSHYRDDYKQLGQMLNEWGEFLYNDHYDTDISTPNGPFGKVINNNIVENPFYNSALSNSPVIANNCDPGLPADQYQACVEQAMAATLNIPGENSDFENMDVESLISGMQGLTTDLNFGMAFLPMQPNRPNVDHFQDKYVGFYNSQYISYNKTRAGGLEEGGVSSSSSGAGGSVSMPELADDDTESSTLPGNAITGMAAINRIHRSSSRSNTVGWGDFNYNNSESGYSNTVTDFMDLNGDGYPDIITSENYQSTTMTGGHRPASGNPLYGDVTKEYSYFAGLTASKSFEHSGKKEYNKCVGEDGQHSLSYGHGPASATIGLTATVAGTNDTREYWFDVNGDGLSDRVKKDEGGNYAFQLNKGQSASTGVFEPFTELLGYSSSPGEFNASVGWEMPASGLFDAGDYDVSASFDFNAGFSGGNSSTDVTFIDINGDGLSDLVSGDLVRYNTGTGFGPQTNLVLELDADSRSLSVAASGTGSLFFGFPVCCWIAPLIHIKGGISIGGNTSLTLQQTRKIFKDLNGDGFMDYIQYGNDELNVRYSAIGRTNMLKTVVNPLGGEFTLDYEASAKSYGNPHSKWVMSKVTIKDGYNKVNDGFDNYTKTYKYEGGYYDRREREFYGFETVKTIDHDENGNVYRTFVSKYHNQSYYLKGLLKESYVMKGDNPNALFTKTENTYVLKELDDTTGLIDLGSNPPLTYDTGGTEGRSTAVALLTGTMTSVYELGSTPIVSGAQMEYNNLGRVTKYIHQGDVNISGDEYYSEIDYHSSAVLQGNNLIDIPSEIRVFDNNSQLVRKRQTLILDETKGTIGQISAFYTGGDAANTIMEYDQYGNLTKVTLPQNDNGQAMFYQYTYDTLENKYVTQVVDAYGYTSSTTYGYGFDTLETTTDITGNMMIREYDNFGRLINITGPNETAQNLPYTIKMEYYPRYSTLPGNVSISQSDFMPVAVTSHYDPQHPGNDIQTYTFMDGIGRAVQVKKDIEMDMGDGTTQERMSVSGKVSYDMYGRGVSQYHPWHEAKQLPDNFVINEADTSPNVGHTEYDELDRVTTTIDPAGSESITEYSIAGDFFSNPALKVKSLTDQGGNFVETEVFKDINGRVTSTKNVLTGNNAADIWTSFAYSSIGELQSYTDNEGLVTGYQYDLLGRKTRLEHPDNGVTSYTYDAAGNLTSVQTANLEADVTIPVQDRFIKYLYDHNRVTDIVFPDTAGNSNIANVKYTYGSSGNETGRVTEQTDATGIQRFAYGNMGEIVHNRRTVVGPNIPTMTFDTRFVYDSWNRIQSIRYPDSEEVLYKYDRGGNLRTVEGTYMGQPYPYVKNVYYDHYEQRSYLQYGNGTETFYHYTPELRRLNKLHVTTSSQEDLLLNDYTYDNVGNILSIKNNAQPNSVNKMGGYYVHEYKYDNLNRLTRVRGSFEGDPTLGELGGDYNSNYDAMLEYNTTHGMVLKKQYHEKNFVQADAYDNHYTYYEGRHQVKYIEDPGTGINESFVYDLNGNLTKRHDTNGNVRGFHWDEVNRLRVVEDSQEMQHYIYDASGERVLKAGSAMESIYENGTLVNGSSVTFNAYTTYPSAFIVMNLSNAQYSKHYYAGSQRVVSRIGEEAIEYFVDQEGLAGRPAAPAQGKEEGQAFDAEKLRRLQISDLTAIMEKAKRGVPAFKKYGPQGEEQQNQQEQDTENLQKSDLPQTTMMAPPQGLIYFYHPDHLGTSTFLTDVNGQPYQFFLNLPFGETMAEQHSQTEDWETPYKFNGKELDPETGYYYYGARYYDPRTSIWLSVDPEATKMPSWSPYNFSFNNPVKFVDPDGKIPIIPWLLKATAGAAADMLAQASMDYLFNPNTSSWSQAFDNVNWWQVTRSGAEGLIPWKTPGGLIGKAALTASGDVLVNAMNDPNGYTSEQAGLDFTTGFIGELAGSGFGSLIAQYGAKNVARGLVAKMGWASKRAHALTGVWYSSTDGNFVGNLATRLGNIVQDIDVDYKFSGGAGDVDIVTSNYNIEVKSGNKMKLTQSLKNLAYAQSQGKQYILYMPNATPAQIREAKNQGITVYNNEAALKKAIKK